MPIRFRKAVPADLPLLLRWGANAHVVAAAGDWAWQEADLARESPFEERFIAELDGRPLGFVQVMDPAREPSHYWGEIEEGLRAIDIWIGEPGDLGRGHGAAMMRLAVERCFSDERVTAIVIDPLASNTRAHRFYERLGFRATGDRRLHDHECRVMRLERAHWRR